MNAYLQTSAVRGGAFIVASAKLNQYFDEPFVFVMKCDFESKIARITVEKSLLHQVEMAINAKNMKSIQYPFMPEVGMLEECEIKIHQSSHAKYFEDFLKYVEYEKTLPEVVNEQVMGLVQQHMETKWQDSTEDHREQEERRLEMWAASEQRELQEQWTPVQVMEATSHLLEHKPDLDMKFKVDQIAIKALLSDYGYRVHIAKSHTGYVVLIEGQSIQFEKGVSPIELLQPEQLHEVINKINNK